MALDFISLLLSKDAPVQAGLTISPFLKANIPTGTLGADKVQGSRLTEAQKIANKKVAKGWKIQSLNKTVDGILASAARLESEIQVETKYWEQVLAVSEKGWAVCQLPQERHTLAVRFGFSECKSYSVPAACALLTLFSTAAPEFRNRGLGALRRNEDGSVALGEGLAASQTKVMRVRIRTDGIFTGIASLPSPLGDDASVEAFILQARNAIFEEELYHELEREARTLTNQGVQSISDTVICPISSTQELVLDYVPLEDVDRSSGTSTDDTLAETISLALHLLLSHAHYQNLRRRSKAPPPISSQKRPTAPYHLLRPVLTRAHHQTSIAALHSLLKPLCQTLNHASIPSSYTLISKTPNTPIHGTEVATHEITDRLIDRLEVEAQLKLADKITFTIRLRTTVFPFASSHFQVSSTGLEADPAPQALNAFDEVSRYLLFASTCAIASLFVVENPESEPSENAGELTGTEEEGDSWTGTVDGRVIRKTVKSEGRSKTLRFEMEDPTRLLVEWRWMGGDDQKSKPGEGHYIWDSEKNDQSKVPSLREVVEEAGQWVATGAGSVTDSL
jgi:mediator of RNA polymerase II transcription subunit 17